MTRWYPRDPRWQGSQKHYFNMATFRSPVLIIYVILVIVEGSLFQSWRREWGYRSGSPYDFWSRHGPYLLIDAALSLSIAYCVYREIWHPVIALTTSILAFFLWTAGCLMNALLPYYSEYSFRQRSQWESISYGESAMQAIIALSYLTMMGFAAKAVHEWRKNSKNAQTSVERRADGMERERPVKGFDKNGFVGRDGSAV